MINQPKAKGAEMSNIDRSEPERDWNREQWEGEGQDDIPHTHEPKPDDVPHWNKHQWVGEGQGDTDPAPHPDKDMEGGEHGYSGKAQNPGGGERWANVDPD
jgi:hypothetical protein